MFKFIFADKRPTVSLPSDGQSVYSAAAEILTWEQVNHLTATPWIRHVPKSKPLVPDAKPTAIGYVLKDSYRSCLLYDHKGQLICEVYEGTATALKEFATVARDKIKIDPKTIAEPVILTKEAKAKLKYNRSRLLEFKRKTKSKSKPKHERHGSKRVSVKGTAKRSRRTGTQRTKVKSDNRSKTNSRVSSVSKAIPTRLQRSRPKRASARRRVQHKTRTTKRS